METATVKSSDGIVTLNQSNPTPLPISATKPEGKKRSRAVKALPSFTDEKSVLSKLKLDKKDSSKLTKQDHINIAAAAKPVSKSLRKSNPQLACALYYVHYKHTKLAKAMKGANAPANEVTA